MSAVGLLGLEEEEEEEVKSGEVPQAGVFILLVALLHSSFL